MDRLTGTTAQYSFLSGTTFTNAYTYDAASNRTGYTAPDGSTNTYSYDTLNRLTSLVNSATGTFGFSYDALSRRTQLTRPNGITTNYSYDSLSRLLSVLHQSGTSTIDGAEYTLDSAGNRTAKADEYAGVTSDYTYDALYELTQVTQGSTTTESYSYDPVGNRTASLGVSSYTTNSSNEMTANSNASYTYDSNGNTLTKTDSSGTTDYSWDYENRMTSVTLPGSAGTVTFKYDPFGRRIEKISPTTTSIFAYDGNNLIEETNSSGVEIASYTQTQNIDEPLAMDRGGTIDFYQQDSLGSVTSLTNSAGTVAQTYTYDSFGNTTASSGSFTNPFRYAGRDFDSDTGLYYYRARYYDPQPGRFLSEDPLRFGISANSGPRLTFLTSAAMRGRSADFYTYVSNRPINDRDPMGLWQATIGGGYEVGVQITFGHNDGKWDFGFDIGGGDGLFLSVDMDPVSCDSGLNIHGEGDLGVLVPDADVLGLGGNFNMSQSGVSAGLTIADPDAPMTDLDLDPGLPAPHPTLGVGVGAVVGVGYTWSW